MKKLLKICGLMAFAALMFFNIKLSSSDEKSTLTLESLENVALAQSEGGGGYGWNGRCYDCSYGGVSIVCYYGGYYCTNSGCLSGYCN